jgi:hypothetical protein
LEGVRALERSGAENLLIARLIVDKYFNRVDKSQKQKSGEPTPFALFQTPKVTN